MVQAFVKRFGFGLRLRDFFRFLLFRIQCDCDDDSDDRDDDEDFFRLVEHVRKRKFRILFGRFGRFGNLFRFPFLRYLVDSLFGVAFVRRNGNETTARDSHLVRSSNRVERLDAPFGQFVIVKEDDFFSCLQYGFFHCFGLDDTPSPPPISSVLRLGVPKKTEDLFTEGSRGEWFVERFGRDGRVPVSVRAMVFPTLPDAIFRLRLHSLFRGIEVYRSGRFVPFAIVPRDPVIDRIFLRIEFPFFDSKYVVGLRDVVSCGRLSDRDERPGSDAMVRVFRPLLASVYDVSRERIGESERPHFFPFAPRFVSPSAPTSEARVSVRVFPSVFERPALSRHVGNVYGKGEE